MNTAHFLLCLLMLAGSSSTKAADLPSPKNMEMSEHEHEKEWNARKGKSFITCLKHVSDATTALTNHGDMERKSSCTCYPLCMRCAFLEGSDVSGCTICSCGLAKNRSFHEPANFCDCEVAKIITCAKGDEEGWSFASFSFCDAGVVVAHPACKCARCLDCSCINKDNSKSCLKGTGKGCWACCGILGQCCLLICEIIPLVLEGLASSD